MVCADLWDFIERLRAIHDELIELNTEATDLTAISSKNMEGILA